MAYSWSRRNELAATRLEMLGVARDESVSAYQQERKMGLGNEAGRAEFVREHDWFYQGTVGSTPERKAPIDTPTTARQYVKGFLYKGRSTPSRQAARTAFVDTTGGVDWQLWRDFRLNYRAGAHGPAAIATEEGPEHFEIFENELYDEE